MRKSGNHSFAEGTTMMKHPGRRRNTWAVGLTPAVLLALGYWLAGDRPAARAQAPAGAGQPPPAGQPDYTYFERLKKQIAEQRKKADEKYQKTREAAQPHIAAQAKARGATDQAQPPLGVTLAEINARLQPGAPPLPP